MAAPAPRRLRIACVQLSPMFKDVAASIARADALISSLEPGMLDLLVLPEMAFTGYCFESRDDIEPWLEDPLTGSTSTWCSTTAARLGCYVLAGFPSLPSSNSLLLHPPTGLPTTYSKHFLYTTDESWALPGPSFKTLSLPFPPSSPSFGGEFVLCPTICMDLNPEKFEAPFEKYELARFVEESRAEVVVCAMAWLDSEPAEGEQEDNGEAGEEWEKVRGTLGYWAARLAPLLGSGVAFVACNRVGREGEVVFTGSSCVMKLEDPPEVLAHASKRREEVIRMVLDLPER